MVKSHLLLYGKNSVRERLMRNPASIRRIYLQHSPPCPDIEKLINEKNIAFERVSGRELEKMRPAKDIQGIIAEVGRYEYVFFEDLLSASDAQRPVLIFLDRVVDPQNLGAIIRTAACFGAMALVIPRHEACGVNETVLHVASGGENHVPVSRVPNLSQALRSAKERGYWIVGAIAGGSALDLGRFTLPFPLGVVLGSEGEGVRYGVEKQLDFKVTIPMKGAPLSYNVSMACAIFCYEIAKQRKVDA